MAKLSSVLPKFSLSFALNAALLSLLCFSNVRVSHARIGGQWNEALIDGGTFDSEPKLDSSKHPGLEVNRQSVECGHHNLDIGQSVTIQSQNYPENHPIQHTCTWYFQATSRDSTILMTCDDFQLQGEEYGCLILKGGGLKTKVCNSVQRFKVKSHDDRLEASFSTKGKAGSGFQCTVTALDSNLNAEYYNTLDDIRESINGINEKIMTSSPCKPNWKYFQNSCYFFSTAETSWDHSRETCQSVNSDLVKISTQPEFNFIRSNTEGEDTWIGLNDKENEGNFTWISDGTPLEDWQDENWWKPGAPDNHGGAQHCGEIDDGYLMNDDFCDYENPYVCEMNI